MKLCSNKVSLQQSLLKCLKEICHDDLYITQNGYKFAGEGEEYIGLTSEIQDRQAQC